MGPLAVGFPTDVLDGLYAGWVSHGRGGAVLGVVVSRLDVDACHRQYINGKFLSCRCSPHLESTRQTREHHNSGSHRIEQRGG